jgi:hypothetical protein
MKLVLICNTIELMEYWNDGMLGLQNIDPANRIKKDYQFHMQKLLSQIHYSKAV